MDELLPSSPNCSNTLVVCRLSNTRTGETEVYKEATYTKIDGVYGYICVDGFKVKFFYEYNGQVCCDHFHWLIVTYVASA